jgi:hypothetical protein
MTDVSAMDGEEEMFTQCYGTEKFIRKRGKKSSPNVHPAGSKRGHTETANAFI